MDLEIKPDERVDRAVRRLVRAQLKDAIRAARDRGQSSDERVHNVRTRLKRSRAAIALVAPRAGSDAKREDRRLRRAGRQLAKLRDLAVQARTFLELGAKSSADVPRELAAKLRYVGARLGAELPPEKVERALAHSTRRLKRLRRKLPRWSVPHGRRAASDGLTTTYRQARRALAAAVETPNPKRFHDLRKRVKALSYELRMLEGRLRGLHSLSATKVEKLADLLGDLHDLDVAYATVARHPSWFDNDASAALALVDQRRKRLENEVLALARPIFAARTRDLRARLALD